MLPVANARLLKKRCRGKDLPSTRSFVKPTPFSAGMGLRQSVPVQPTLRKGRDRMCFSETVGGKLQANANQAGSCKPSSHEAHACGSTGIAYYAFRCK